MRLAGVLLLCACASSTAAPPPPPEAPVASATPSVAPAPVAVETAKKRTRTGPPNPGARDGTKPKNGRPLNPHDPSGRTVFVRPDDHCFIEVASSDPNARATEVVDCPAEANDPAYDHCTAQIVFEPGTSRCYCVTGRGSPRPMPNPTPCPANAK